MTKTSQMTVALFVARRIKGIAPIVIVACFLSSSHEAQAVITIDAAASGGNAFLGFGGADWGIFSRQDAGAGIHAQGNALPWGGNPNQQITATTKWSTADTTNPGAATFQIDASGTDGAIFSFDLVATTSGNTGFVGDNFGRGGPGGGDNFDPGENVTFSIANINATTVPAGKQVVLDGFSALGLFGIDSTTAGAVADATPGGTLGDVVGSWSNGRAGTGTSVRLNLGNNTGGLLASSIDITSNATDTFRIRGVEMQFSVVDAQAEAVPEPSTYILATLGLLSLVFVGWRRRRR